MKRTAFVALMIAAACGSDKPSVEQAPPQATAGQAVAAASLPTAGSAAAGPVGAPSPAPPLAAVAAPASAAPPPTAPASPPEEAPRGHSFLPEAKALLAAGACGDGEAPATVTAKQLEKHCAVIRSAQEDYAARWVKPARAFFAEHVPGDAPRKVVYPFAGGDLSTALTVYPDADEITTLSLEPAGDPRTLAVLAGKELEAALGKVQYELKFLYRVNFSNTLNMIEAMRGGALPTQLIFGLSALKLHGFELAGLRYFTVDRDGALVYLDDAAIAAAPSPTRSGTAEKRNRVFSNAEVMFRRPGGRLQVWRHIRHNLGNAASRGIGPGLQEDPGVLRHLESKGPIVAMTKAASYLLSWESFSIMRDYLTRHVVWMVSDATGVAPKWGKAAGFEYETYGGFVDPHIPAGSGIARDWRGEFSAQPKRDLGFRFGYYDKRATNHLVIMRRKS